MTTFLGTAIVSMTLALVFYSIGTWAERIQKILKLWHITFFVLGLFADSFGTTVMIEIAGENMNSLHASTGALALLLMAIHALWAIWTYWKGSQRAKQNFSKFSVFVWAFWLIPYVLGIVLGMSH
ncbi:MULTISPECIES: HsmA family protein [Butyricimonas]|uniref:HsmA family protein n=1 Tax=Butyricimonas TaxID=574697 RepID=UPI0007FB5622|nr:MULTISPECIES: HsmA family protein [Butyricimonas]